jgi:L-ribulokinase
LTLNHRAHHLYRALLEGSAFGLRWIVDILRDSGVPVERFIATGGLPHHNPGLVQIYADVLGEPVGVHPCKHGPALGAAILGVLAAGQSASGFASSSEAIAAMAGDQKGVAERTLKIVAPDAEAHRQYRDVYDRYRRLADTFDQLQ